MSEYYDKDGLLNLLKKYDLVARKSLGQNFLVDSRVLDKILESAELKDSDRVVEVGAGPGILSRGLAGLVGELISLEIDKNMILPWHDTMRNFTNAKIIYQDVLRYLPVDKPYKLVANIPYYITSPILKHFLRKQSIRRPELIILMIQKEVAERICDKKKPTLLSWEIRVFGSPEIVCHVPPASFYPSPRVDSAVIRIRLFDKPLLEEKMPDEFFQLLEISYKQPRKTLMNNLLSSRRWPKDLILRMFEKSGIDEKARPHQLDFDDWRKLYALLIV